MATNYPAALDTTTQLPNTRADATTTATNHAADHDNLADAVIAVETELGINPRGSSASVVARLNAMDTADTALFGRWVPLMDAWVNLTAPTAATYYGQATVSEEQAGSFATVMQYLDPADLAITGKTVQYRVVAMFMQNATANTGTTVHTAGLYPVTAGGTTTTFTPTFGAVVTGSTAARTGGSASSEARVISSTFTAPAADTFALGVAVSVATGAGSTRVGLRLDYNYA